MFKVVNSVWMDKGKEGMEEYTNKLSTMVNGTRVVYTRGSIIYDRYNGHTPTGTDHR